MRGRGRWQIPFADTLVVEGKEEKEVVEEKSEGKEDNIATKK